MHTVERKANTAAHASNRGSRPHSLAIEVVWGSADTFLNNHPVVNQVLLNLCDITVLVIGVLGLWRAVREGHRMKRWFSFLLFALGCTLIDEFVVMPFLLGTVPWLMLFINLLLNHSSIRF